MGKWSFILSNRTVFWSDEVFRIFDRKLEHGQPSFSEIHEAIHIADRFEWELMINQVSITGRPAEVEVRIYVSNEGVKRIRMSAEGVFEDTVLVSIRGTCLDVTQEKAQEWTQASIEKRS